MPKQNSNTIAAENRDFPEWHRGRKTYAVWILRCDTPIIQNKFKAARKHLANYLLEPYQRQPHITLFVCGFLVGSSKYNDDFTYDQLQAQIQVLKRSDIRSFEIEIGNLNSFTSAPYLEIHDPDSGISRLRKTLSLGADEFRTAPYTPHLTVGLYRDSFSFIEVLEHMEKFSYEPIRLQVSQVTLATYQAHEFAGMLGYEKIIEFAV